MECAGSESEVLKCTSGPDAAPFSQCPLWIYRMGKDPTPSKANIERGKRLNKSKSAVKGL